MGQLARLNISDDFLFGCVLQEGEYISPIVIPKNEPRRARDNWQRVVSLSFCAKDWTGDPD